MRFVVERASLPPPDGFDSPIQRLLTQINSLTCDRTNAPQTLEMIADMIEEQNSSAPNEDLIFVVFGSTEEAIAPFKQVAYEALVGENWMIMCILKWFHHLRFHSDLSAAMLEASRIFSDPDNLVENMAPKMYDIDQNESLPADRDLRQARPAVHRDTAREIAAILLGAIDRGAEGGRNQSPTADHHSSGL